MPSPEFENILYLTQCAAILRAQLSGQRLTALVGELISFEGLQACVKGKIE